MKIVNNPQIRSEDFKKEDQDAISKLAGVLNPFLQEVVDFADKRIDFDNRVENLITIEMTVDSTGTPVLNDKVNVRKSNVRGITVINAINMTNRQIYPSGQPFISFNPLGGTTIQINNITNLPENNKFRLTMVVY
jgi:hypothetical protein